MASGALNERQRRERDRTAELAPVKPYERRTMDDYDQNFTENRASMPELYNSLDSPVARLTGAL
jgi:hypothetical protein